MNRAQLEMEIVLHVAALDNGFQNGAVFQRILELGIGDRRSGGQTLGRKVVIFWHMIPSSSAAVAVRYVMMYPMQMDSLD